MKKSKKDDKKPSYRIPPDGPWANAWKLSAVVGGVGLAAALFGMLGDAHRFAFSWLFAFMTFLAVGLGSLFFVIAQHLTGSGWGVTVRRSSELLMSGLPVFALLFVPILLNLEELYPWYGQDHGEHEEIHDEGASDEHGSIGFGSPAHAQEEPEAARPLQPRHDVFPNLWGQEGVAPQDEGLHAALEAEHHHVLGEKHAYFDLRFFVARAAVYLIAWILLSFFFFSWSTRQDKEKGLELTKTMQRWAPISTFVFALTLTFAAFDWSMSLEPAWYSTIFGVQYFAVSCVIGLVSIILLTLGIRRSGLVGEAINVEHYHDLGKLTHGFLIFWAYISLSQLLLIWYVGIPEEATYYHLRWAGGGGFKLISIVLVLAHFVVPFFLLLSRNTKRRLEVLMFACVWLAVMHVVEVYWLIMPYADQTDLVSTSLRVHWMDIAALCAVGGIYLTVVFWQMTRYPLVPIGDPRLERALKFENA